MTKMENPESFPSQDFVLGFFPQRKSVYKDCNVNGHFQWCSNLQESKKVCKA